MGFFVCEEFMSTEHLEFYTLGIKHFFSSFSTIYLLCLVVRKYETTLQNGPQHITVNC